MMRNGDSRRVNDARKFKTFIRLMQIKADGYDAPLHRG